LFRALRIKEKERRGVMPQLDAYVFFTQVFWLLVTFSVLFYLCNALFLPRILGSLVARSTLTSMATAAESFAWENGLDPILGELTPQFSPVQGGFLGQSAELLPLWGDGAQGEIRYLHAAAAVLNQVHGQ
jgi:Plant ATP synthase F0